MRHRVDLVRRLWLAGVLVPLILTGCATLGGTPNLEQYKPVVHAALTLGIGQLCVRYPVHTAHVLDATLLIGTVLDSDDFLTIDLLEEAVQERFAWGRLPPEARPVVDAALVLLFAQLQSVIARYEVPHLQSIALIREAVDWVQEAAKRCDGPPRRRPAVDKRGKDPR